MSQLGFLKVKGTSIIDKQGKPVFLRGVNFGGWLMMEAYFVHSANFPQQAFEKDFIKQRGQAALEELLKAFRSNFITEADVRQVASWGMNCLRLPFHYKIAEGKNISYLDEAIGWCRKHKVYVILDLHAAPGAQNQDWHSDSLNGKAALWTQKANRHKTYALWERLAHRYKNETAVAGYDVLNEAVLDDAGLLNEFYRETIKAIRRSDRNHMLFIEGKQWAQHINVLDEFSDDNWLYSIHFYAPMEFTFNLIPFMRYPWPGWDKDVMRRRMDSYAQFARQKQRPVHVGEFGVHYREGVYNEHLYLKDELKIFHDFGFHWNYWTYKAVKHYMLPDGIYSYYANSPWVHRIGPKSGWQHWAELWPKHKVAMAASWRTKAFTANTYVLDQLKKACHRKAAKIPKQSRGHV